MDKNKETRSAGTERDIPPLGLNDDACLLILKSADLFTLLALRRSNAYFRNLIDQWLTPEHMVELLETASAAEYQKFMKFGQFVFLADVPLNVRRQMVAVIQRDVVQRITREQLAGDVTYITGTAVAVGRLVAPVNISSVIEAEPEQRILYADRDFTITQGLIGEGAHSVVVLGGLRKERGNYQNYTVVAVKRALRSIESRANDPQLQAALQAEIEIQSQIKFSSRVMSLYIAEIVSIGHSDIALHYYPHGDLGRFISRNHNNLSLLPRLLLCRSLTQCMLYLRSIGLLHRDIKATNILVNVDGTLRLSDFALAKFVLDNSHVNYGTVLYQSPKILKQLKELMQSRRENPELQAEDLYTHADEIYSLTLVFYQIFTSLSPYAEFSVQIRNNDLDVLSSYIHDGGRPHVPNTLKTSIKALITRGWDINERARPDLKTTQEELVKEIYEFASPSSVPK